MLVQQLALLHQALCEKTCVSECVCVGVLACHWLQRLSSSRAMCIVANQGGAARRALFLFSGLTYLYFVVMLILLLQLLYLTLLKSSVDEFAGGDASACHDVSWAL